MSDEPDDEVCPRYLSGYAPGYAICARHKAECQSEIARLRADVERLRDAIAPVVAEINNRWSDVHDESWNADYHCEFEMTVAECRTLLKALEQPCKP